MTTIENVFRKRYSETVDNRAEPLPVLWSKPKYQSINYTIKQERRVYDSVSDKYSIKNAVLDTINSAEQMVVMCSFLLSDNDVEQAMLHAADRGVRVYCLVASEARLDQEKPEGEFDKKVHSEHKTMLKKLAGKVMFRTSSSFHAKAVIADPNSSTARGVLLTANLATDAMQRNEELLIQLEQIEIKQVIGYLKWALWEAAEHESIESGAFSSVKSLGQIEHPAESKPVVATTQSSEQIRSSLLDLIRSAESDIQVSCFGWDLEHEVVQALISKAKEGVEVEVFSRTRPASMPVLAALADAGAKVFGFRWLHAKAIVVDKKHGMVMSANFQKHGLDEGFELGLEISNDRLEALWNTLQYWKKQCQWQLQTKATVGDVNEVLIWVGSEWEVRKVKEVHALDLGDKVASSAESLSTAMPAIPSNGKLPYLAHSLEVNWHVIAPKLAKGSKQEFKTVMQKTESTRDDKTQKGKQKDQVKQVPYTPPVFKEPDGRRVVVVKTEKQLEGAIRLKTELSLNAIVVGS
jgi:cardiolipin synthase